MAPACSSSVVGGSTAGGGDAADDDDATGEQGGGGSTHAVTISASGSYTQGEETVCIDRLDLWAQLGASAATGTGGAPGTGGSGGAGGEPGTGGAPEGRGGAGGAPAGETGSGGHGGAGGSVPPGCPTADQAAEIVSAEVPLWADSIGDPSLQNGQCCYVVQYSSVSSGRPLHVDGRVTTARAVSSSGRGGGAAAWTGSVAVPASSDLAPDERPALAAHWSAIARLEHASIASFAKLTLELLLVGAPADLVRDAQQAGLDEVRHAQDAFALASVYAGASVGPSSMPELGALRPECSIEAIVAAAIVEGCVAETLGAFEVGEQAVHAHRDLAVVLEAVAADEARHAALAWRIVRWAIEDGRVSRDHVRTAFAGAIAAARGALDPASLGGAGASQLEERLALHGVLPRGAQRRLHAEVLDRIAALAADIVS